MTKTASPYNQGIFFKIEQLAKYIQEDYISKYNFEVSHDEFRAMDIINYNPDICQRDLAKLILRDCVKTGRILDKLEKKGFIKRFQDTKGNRLVKKMNLTEEGNLIYNTTLNELEPNTKALFKNIFTQKEIENLNTALEKLQTALSKEVNVHL